MSRRAACLRCRKLLASKMAFERFGAQRQKTESASPLFQVHENLSWRRSLSGLERSDKKIRQKNDNPGCFSGVAIKHRRFRSKVHQPKLMLQPDYCAVMTATVVACAMMGAPTSSGFRRIT